MQGLSDYSENDRRFYESIGLLVAGEVSAEKAAEISGYSFSTYIELLRARNIYPYIYGPRDYEMDLKALDTLTSK